MLAEEGFTALALDMYGDKKLASHPKDAKNMAYSCKKHIEMYILFILEIQNGFYCMS